MEEKLKQTGIKFLGGGKNRQHRLSFLFVLKVKISNVKSMLIKLNYILIFEKRVLGPLQIN
jgi:hypothetical protein